MSNKRLGAILLSIPFLTLAAACGPSSEASSNTAIVSPSSEVTSAVTTSVEMVPAQTGLAEHVEYEFTGTMATSIGDAKVIADLFFDKTYSIIATVMTYSSKSSWGTWEYAAKVFTLTDTDNSLSFKTTVNDNTYSFTMDIKGTAVPMTAAMTGYKAITELHVDPNPSTTPTDPTLISTKKVVTVFKTEGADGFYVDFYDNGKLAVNNTQASQELGSGTWSYSEVEGLKIKVDDKDVTVAFKNDIYGFSISVHGYSRDYSITKAELVSDIERGGPAVKAADRYSATSDADWATLWADKESTDKGGEYVSANIYADATLDPQMETVVPKADFVPLEASKQGTIKRLDYTSYIYSYYYYNSIPESNWEKVYKTAYVYLPAGYDSTQKYDVYYLMHGAGGSEDDWFAMNCDGTTVRQGGDFMLMADTLISQGKIKPTIFVSATTNTDISVLKDGKARNSFNASYQNADFPYELENDLIPAVEAKYSTYAAGNVTHANLVATRDHRAFAGLSMGAYIVWNTMPKTIDVMSYYAPIANGCDTSSGAAGISSQKTAADKLFTEMTSGDNASYKMGYLFAACGKRDHTWDAHMPTVDEFYDKGKDSYFTYGDNFYSFNPADGTHSAKYFLLGVYDSMKVFFK
jgi:hypothetical protein